MRGVLIPLPAPKHILNFLGVFFSLYIYVTLHSVIFNNNKMKKQIFIPFIISLSLMGCANLSSDLQSALNTRNDVSVRIPKNATQITEDIFSLGEKEIDGKKVEGYMI